MALAAGTRLGPYEILALLGAGGMGEVYRARDTKLQREVAVKVLPDAFANDPDRTARFTREALLLASLNHPGIAQIYGVEDRALIMELVPGPTLADRIASGPIPLDEALPLAAQIAEAVEYAHDHNVVHRDLKPANVKITPEGTVKVLDFGLAKALADEPDSSDPRNSPTLTMTATRMGVVLGTAAYMAPEQAKGKPVDRRADIWAFGVVLYEMLAGKPLHHGETVAETMASVILKEAKLDGLPADTPPAIVTLLRRCLEKDPKQRLQAIGEARILLRAPIPSEPESAPLQVAAPPRHPFAWIAATAALAAATLVLALIVFSHFRETPPPERVARYTISMPLNSAVHSFAVSPDGRYVAIAALVDSKRQLWLRPLDALQAQPMPTTDDATYPFWSPDSRFIGFFAQGKLKKVSASGGPAQSLCDAPQGRGGAWNREDVIVFSPTGSNTASLQRVAAAGGVPSDVIAAKSNYRFPAFLPDGRHFLYETAATSPEKNGVWLASLNGKENRRLLPDVSSAVFAPPASGSPIGHLLFVRENNVMAQPFDAANARPAGDVVPVAEGVSLAQNNFAPVSVSENGVLLYWAGGGLGGTTAQIVWYDHAGKLLSTVGMPGDLRGPAIAPDERTIAFSRFGAASSDIWLRDLSRGTDRRFTSDQSQNVLPFWSPQGDRIAFSSNRSGGFNLYQKPSSGSGPDELLLSTPNNKLVDQWSRDGRFIVYSQLDPNSQWDLWVLPLGPGPAADRKPTVFLNTQFNELQGQIGPDGHWMAYTSDESGRREVYVRPFPTAEAVWRISTAGGEQPRWRGDGKELFYAAPDGRIIAVSVKASAGAKPSFEPDAPVPLFNANLALLGTNNFYNYDVTADGKRFLVSTNTSAASPGPTLPLTVVLNWQAGLKK